MTKQVLCDQPQNIDLFPRGQLLGFSQGDLLVHGGLLGLRLCHCLATGTDQASTKTEAERGFALLSVAPTSEQRHNQPDVDLLLTRTSWDFRYALYGGQEKEKLLSHRAHRPWIGGPVPDQVNPFFPPKLWRSQWGGSGSDQSRSRGHRPEQARPRVAGSNWTDQTTITIDAKEQAKTQYPKI